jgi:hypothetical protein
MRQWIRSWKSKKELPQVVTDLDALISKPVGFRFHGRIHIIPPLEVAEFLKATSAIAAIDELRTMEKLTEEDLVDRYSRCFAIVCPTVTKDLVQKMSLQQIAALYNLVLEAIMGKAQVDLEKKSSLKPTGIESPPSEQGS